MNYGYVILAILTMAVVTYLIRVLPFALVKNKIENKFIRSFLEYIPYAVLAAMTFPAILFSNDNIIACATGLLVAVILAYLEKSLMKVALGASSATFLVAIIPTLF